MVDLPGRATQREKTCRHRLNWRPMSVLAAPAPRSLPHRFAALLTFALLLVLAWQLAHWTWYFAAPRDNPAAVTASAAPADWNAARRLFGNAPPASAASAGGSMRLKGVFAVDGKTLSAAVINAGGKRDLAVKLGEEIEKGVTLVAVQSDHIEISRNGVRERIDLDKRIVAAPSARPGAPGARGFRINVANVGANQFSLSRSELNTTLQDPSQLAYTGRIGVNPAGGVRMDSAPAGSLPDKLGLKEGDVIKSVNGQPVGSAGDLARLYGQFSSISNIRVEIIRAGNPMVLNFQIQP